MLDNKCFICGKTYDQGRLMTCSDSCHEELIGWFIAKFGEFKKVVRGSTGVAYKVPTRDILEGGIKERDLDHYPIWDGQ